MRRRTTWLWSIAAGAIALLSTASIAGDNCRRCPHCEHELCEPVYAPIQANKHCWEVDFKTICIPSFKWPWQSCCEPSAGRVKTVKVLRRIEYECEQCGYRWEASRVTCQCE